VAYSPHFDRDLRIVLLANADFSDYVVLCSTDLEQPAEQVAEYYRLRYRFEFVIRDAKQHAGLTHCQARSQEKIDFHLNMSACGGRIAPPASPKTGLFAVYLPPGVVQSDAHQSPPRQTRPQRRVRQIGPTHTGSFPYGPHGRLRGIDSSFNLRGLLIIKALAALYPVQNSFLGFGKGVLLCLDYASPVQEKLVRRLVSEEDAVLSSRKILK
jgi:hypothetical protein